MVLRWSDENLASVPPVYYFVSPQVSLAVINTRPVRYLTRRNFPLILRDLVRMELKPAPGLPGRRSS